MKLSTILIISFVLLGLVGSVGGTYYYYNQSSNLLEVQVVSHLESIAQSTENFVNEVLERLKDKLEIAAIHGNLTVEELKEIDELGEDFYEVFVLDASGIIIVSSDESKIGLDRSSDEYFVGGRTETHIKKAYFSEDTGLHAIAISAPFNEGVLVARIELEAFETLVSDTTGLGETGESLLGYKNDEGGVVFFTRRRFEETGPMGHEETHVALPMKEALDKKEMIIMDSRDYRHVEVVAVTRYLDAIDVGLVTKIDKAEALGVLRNKLIRAGILVILVILIFFSFVGFFVARWVSKPIKKLTLKVDEVTKGKLDVQLPRSGIFEVQSLADSLNRILASLKLAILRTGASSGELGLGEAVKAKAEAEDKYKALYESSRDAIMTLAPPTWNFTAGNPATVKMFGAKDEAEFISKGPGKLSPEKQPDGKLSADSAKAHIMKAMKEGSDFFDWTHRRVSGEDFPASVLLTKVVIGGKEVLQATVRDVAEEEKARGRFKELFNHSIDGIVICRLIKDSKGNPVDYVHLDANPGSEKQLGSKKEDLINKKATELIGEKSGLKYAQMNGGVVLTGKSHTWVDHTPAPYNRDLRMDSFPIGGDLFAIIFEDITDGKKIAEPKTLVTARGIPSKVGNKVPSSSGKKVVEPVKKIVKPVMRVPVRAKKTYRERKALSAIEEINQKRKNGVLNGGKK